MLQKTLESPLDYKEIKPVNPKGNQPWIFIGRTDAKVEAPIIWPPGAKRQFIKRPWCWGRLKARGEGDSRGWDGWMASPTRWTWVWANSGRWWRTGKPGHAAVHGVAKNQTELICNNSKSSYSMLCRVQPGDSGFQSPGPLTGKAVAISLKPRGEVAEGPVESPEDFIPMELDVWLCLLRNRLFPAISKQGCHSPQQQNLANVS